MKTPRLWLGLAAPLLLVAGPAFAQQGAPPPAEPRAQSQPSQTRELEGEIEQYPDRSGEARGQGPSDTRIPEQLQAPNQSPAVSRASSSRASSSRSASAARAGATGSIDPAEVQRVFGTDARVIPLGSLDAASITRLQVRLQQLGHYQGSVDGVLGPATRAAIDAYARAQFALRQRLLKQDQLTSDLAEQLGVELGAASGGAPAWRSPGSPDPALPAPSGDAPSLPPGGAPLPPPQGIAPLPTPSSTPGVVPPARGGSTPAAPPPTP